MFHSNQFNFFSRSFDIFIMVPFIFFSCTFSLFFNEKFPIYFWTLFLQIIFKMFLTHKVPFFSYECVYMNARFYSFFSTTFHFIAEQMRKRVFRIKSVSSRCCSWLYWSFSFAGRRCTSSTQSRYSIRILCTKHLATPQSLIFNCWLIRAVAVIRLRTVSWIVAFVKHFWIYSVVLRNFMSRDGWASVEQQRQVQPSSSLATAQHSSAKAMYIDSKHKGCAMIHPID